MYLVGLHQIKSYKHLQRFIHQNKYKKNQFSLHSSDFLEPRNCYLARSLLKASSLTSVLPRHIFVPLNQYVLPKIEPNFLEQIAVFIYISKNFL